MGHTARTLLLLIAFASLICAPGCTRLNSAATQPAGLAAATTAAPAQPAFDYASYVGHWCDSRNARRNVIDSEGMDSVEIVACSSTSIKLTLLHTASAPAYRMTGSETTITAPLRNGVARFTFNDERGGMDSATVTLLSGGALAVNVESLSSGDNGSIQMDCLMRKDQYFDSRQADEPVPSFDFIGVKGDYTRASEPSDVPCIKIRSIDGYTVKLDITGTYNSKVYLTGLVGTVVGDDRVKVDLDSGQSLLLHWTNPGTIVVKCTRGSLPRRLWPLTVEPTYWNAEYLHTS